MNGPLQLWVGPECTVNRVGDRWRDQSEASGFGTRLEDLDRLASIGASRVRLPILWERTVARAGAPEDFAWSDAAMRRLEVLQLPAIVGLLHHGSGPASTNLLDKNFVRLFAEFAGRVAARYPTQRDWTPINEPLTTARFSGLYGHWYPHRRDDRSFVRALLNQVHATAAAMRAIRAINPEARLVQTEDLGFTRATPGVQAQADFDNERRWLGIDLLCGRVDEPHPLWEFLRASGATRRELAELRDRPCVPDVLGINAYVTSERFLDERLHLHPVERHGGNGREQYVDVESVRAHGRLVDGFLPRLRETWARYQRPVAITEVHMGCTREEQLRWLRQAWSAAETARDEGVDVLAVTAWAAFGAYDWRSLLTREDGHYEPGLWDVRGSTPRITAVGRLARALAGRESSPHAVAEGVGWWQRDLRLRVAPHDPMEALSATGRPLLIVGGGTLGRAFDRLCHMRGLPCHLVSRHDMDIADAASVEAGLDRLRPWAVVNAAGFVRVDDAESDPRQWRENAEGPAVLAAACTTRGLPLVCFSSDLVFDGASATPYLEGDPTSPLNAYGRAKAASERAVLAGAPRALVVRTAAFFGPWDTANFVSHGLASLEHGQPWRAAADQVVSPTYVPDLVQASLDLLIDGEAGLWHLTNGEALSWAEFARRVAVRAGLDPEGVEDTFGLQPGQVAARPAYSGLGSERGRLLPSLDDAIARFFEDREDLRFEPAPRHASLA